jgi:hypothetical protein
MILNREEWAVLMALLEAPPKGPALWETEPACWDAAYGACVLGDGLRAIGRGIENETDLEGGVW